LGSNASTWSAGPPVAPTGIDPSGGTGAMSDQLALQR